MSIDTLRELFADFLRGTPIEEDVVQACVDVNFVGKLEGAEIDFSDVEELWQDIIEELVKIVLNHNAEDVIVQLENGEFSLKTVITVLGFAMEKINDKTVQSSIYALLAARIYILLSCLHSSHVFGIYHSTLFTRALASYRGVYQLKQLRVDGSHSKGKKKPPIQTKNTAAAVAAVLSSTTLNSTDIQDDITDNSSPQLFKYMGDLLLRSLEELYIYLQQDNIANRSKSFSYIIELIQLICRFDYTSATKSWPADDFQQFKTLTHFSDRCFTLAHLAMAEKHNREDMVLSMFCLPRLTFKSFEMTFMKGPIPQSLIQMANVMMSFVVNRFMQDDSQNLMYVKRLAVNVCHHCLAERIEYRQSSLQIALKLVKLLPEELIQQFFFFAVNYGYLTNQRCRLIAVDLVCLLLENFDVGSFPMGVPLLENLDNEFAIIFEPVECDDDKDNQQNPAVKKQRGKLSFFVSEDDFNPRHAMLQFLVRAAMDKNAVVRCRGLYGILPFVKTKEGYDELTQHAKEIIADSRLNVLRILSAVNQFDEQQNARDTPALSQGTQATSQGTRAETPVPREVHENAQEEAQFLSRVSVAPFADLIIQRCNDKSPVTRRHTVAIIEALLTVEGNPVYQKALLQKLQDFCRDPSVVVRKLGAEAMTNIVRDEEVFKQAWLHTVLPMVNDREESVEKSCRKMFFDKIILPIIDNNGSESLSWNMIIEIAKTTEFMRALRRCFQQIARDDEYKKILHKLAKVLYDAVKIDAVASSAWMLLDYLADAIDIDPTLAIQAWITSDEQGDPVDFNVRIVTSPKELVSILSILLKRRKSISNDDVIAIRDNLAARLVHLRLHESVISEAIITFVGLISTDASPETQENLQQFFSELIKKLYGELIILPADEMDMSIEDRKMRICRRLLTIGQCTLHAPKSSTTEMINLLTHILSVEAPSLDENTSKVLSRPQTRNGDPFSQTPIECSKLQQLPYSELDGNICATTVIAMGKIMLANEDLARDYLEKLAVVHGTSIHASVRNNVIYVLADCYLRYTTRMDILQPAFLHGLRDRVDFVRYHSLILITELLRSQYMKMSALVLARLLPLLLDPEIPIRDALKGETLAVIEDQFPTVYADNFVTCMFLFNKVGFGAYRDIERYEMPENPICFLNHDFSGALRRRQRMELYKFMLKKLPGDTQRFLLISQISKTIFGNLVEGKIPFDTPEVKQLILDGFQVLELPEAKLTLEEGQRDADDDDGEVATEEMQKLARDTIRVTFQAAFVHHIMPQLMAMARFLAFYKSPLQKEFRNCLAVIAESYPDQLDILFRDSVQLKTEIEAELRRRKKDKRKSRMVINKSLVMNIQRAALNETAAAINDKENTLPSDEVDVEIDEGKEEPMECKENEEPSDSVNVKEELMDDTQSTQSFSV